MKIQSGLAAASGFWNTCNNKIIADEALVKACLVNGKSLRKLGAFGVFGVLLFWFKSEVVTSS